MIRFHPNITYKLILIRGRNRLRSTKVTILQVAEAFLNLFSADQSDKA
jgi:hypothetical protein